MCLGTVYAFALNDYHLMVRTSLINWVVPHSPKLSLSSTEDLCHQIQIRLSWNNEQTSGKLYSELLSTLHVVNFD